MKKQIFIIVTMACCVSHRHAIATCSAQADCINNCTILVGNENNCDGYTTTYYADGNGFMDGEEYGGIISCTRCKSGATRTKATFQVASGCSATYYYCKCNCSTSDWGAGNTGYQKRTVCNTDCSTTTEYRCAVGYYGTSSNGTSGCALCPEWSTVYTTSARTTKVRGTSPVGTTAITGCYVAPGTYYDRYGTFKITGNCPYK